MYSTLHRGLALVWCPCGWFQVWPELNRMHQPSGLPAISFFLRVMCLSKLVCVRGEVLLQRCPLCWVQRGFESVALIPCCNLCSLTCEEDQLLVFCCWDKRFQWTWWCYFCPFCKCNPVTFQTYLAFSITAMAVLMSPFCLCNRPSSYVVNGTR